MILVAMFITMIAHRAYLPQESSYMI